MVDAKMKLMHPQNKHMPRIDIKKYEIIKAAIHTALKNKELTHNELFEDLNNRLKGKIDGNVNWFCEGVKLDLEARKIIVRDDSKPQKYRIK